MEEYRYERWGSNPYVVYKMVEENGEIHYYRNAFGLGWKEDPEVSEEFGMDSDSHYCSKEGAEEYIELMQAVYEVIDGKVKRKDR